MAALTAISVSTVALSLNQMSQLRIAEESTENALTTENARFVGRA